MAADGDTKLIGAKSGEKKGHTPVEAPDSLHSVAYARVDDLVSEGPIEGFANGLQSIFFNETPLENPDGTLNFRNVQVDYRLGTQDQEPIAGFSAVENEITTQVELTAETPWSQSFSNTNLDAIRVTLSVPGMSQTDTSNGDINGSTVDYRIEVATDGGAFLPMFTGAITGKTTSKYQRSHRVNLPRATTGWVLRVVRLTPGSTSGTLVNATWIDSYTEIIDAKLRYPMSAHVATVIDAAQFQNIPGRAFHLKGRLIRVPTNYNPATRAYTGLWDGTFMPAYSNNPAWVFYDLVTNDRYGLGHLVSEALVDRWSLYRIAQWCDELVEDGFGAWEPRLTCNLYIQTRADAYKVLQDLASTFRGVAYWAGGAIVASADQPRDPAYIYAPGNVIEGKFDYAGSGRRARHTVCLVSWNDPQDFFRPKVEYVEDLEGIARYGINQTDVIAIGCTSRGAARRNGRAILVTERYESDLVTFRVGLDGTLCAPGQIIGISDPLKTGRRLGGRIRSASGNAITVDALPSPLPTPGSALMTMTPAGTFQSRAILDIDPATSTITVGTAWDAVPVPESMWAVDAPNLLTQLFRVVSVTEEEPTIFTISALRHEPDKYDYIDTGDPIEPRVVIETPKSDLILSVRLDRFNRKQKYSTETVLVAAWEAPPNAKEYEIQWRKDNGTWTSPVRQRETRHEYPKAYPGTYVCRVSPIAANGRIRQPTYSNVFTLADDQAPPDVITEIQDGQQQSVEDILKLQADLAAEEVARAQADAAETLARLQADVTEAEARAQADADAAAANAAALQDTADELWGYIGDVRDTAAWSDQVAYVDGDLVRSGTTLYRALQNVPAGTALTDPAYWVEIGSYYSLEDALLGTAETTSLNEAQLIQTENSITQLAESINALTVGTGEQFDYINIWHFSANAEGWTAYNDGGSLTSNLTFANSFMTLAGSYTNPRFISPTIGIDASIYNYVKLRVRKSGSPSWEGKLYWTTSADTAVSESKSVTIPEPAWDSNGIATLGFKDIPWVGTMRWFRLDLAPSITSSNYFSIDWVAVGRPSPGASASALQALTTRVTTAEGEVDGLQSTVTAQSTLLTKLDASLGAKVGTKISFERGWSNWTTKGYLSPETSDIYNATVPTAAILQDADLGAVARPELASSGTSIQCNARSFIPATQTGVYRLTAKFKRTADASAPATLFLHAYCDGANWTGLALLVGPDFTLPTVGAVVTQSILFSKSPGSTGAQQMPAGTAFFRVGVRRRDTGAVDTGWVFDGLLVEEIAQDLLDASAMQALDVRVTQTENTNTAQATSLTQLTTRIGNAEATNAAQSTALTSLDSRTTQVEGSLTTQASDITALESSLTGGGNLIPNSEFRDGSAAIVQGQSNVTGYRLSGAGTPTASLSLVNGDLSVAFPDGIWGMLVKRNTGIPLASGEFMDAYIGRGRTAPEAYIPAVGGQRYIASVYAEHGRCTTNIRITWYDSADAAIGSTVPSGPGGFGGGNALNDFTRIYTSGVAPATAVKAQILFRTESIASPSQADSESYWVLPMFEPVSATQTTPSPWSPSALGAASLGVVEAQATAISNLGTRVTSTEQGITAVSEDVSALEASLGAFGGANLLPNPGFEAYSGSNGLADVWTFSGTATNLTWSRPEAINISGSLVRQRVSWSAGVAGEYIQLHPANADCPRIGIGKDYTLSAYCNNNANTESQLLLQWLDSNNAVIGTTATSARFSSSALANRFHLTATAPSGAVKAKPYFRHYALAIGAVLGDYDNVMLSEGPALSPWQDNPTVLANAVQLLDSRVDATESGLTATSNSITQLDSRITGVEGVNNSQATAISGLTTRVTNVEGVNTSQASSLTNLTSRMVGVEGVNASQSTALTNLTTRVTNAEGVNTSQANSLTSLDSRMDGVEGTNASQATAITNLTTRVTNTENTNNSQASSITSLGSRVTDVEGTNASQATAISGLNTSVTTLDGRLDRAEANWFVKLEVNGLVSGLYSVNNGTKAEFGVLADTFRVEKPGGGASLTWENSILWNKGASRSIIQGPVFGQSNDLMFWMGANPTSPAGATKTNASVWIDVNGNASFKGAIFANNLNGALQKFVTVNWTNNDPSVNTSDTFTLAAPVKSEQSHNAAIHLACGIRVISLAGNGSYSGNLYVERQSGTSWVVVWQQVLQGAGSGGISVPITGLDVTAQTAAAVYRVRLTNNTGNNWLSAVTGYLFGLR